MPSRLLLAVLTLLGAFAAGFLSSRLFERNARAQSAPSVSTFFVPSDGLIFRAFDGRMVARLSYDTSGGIFDVYDSHERPSASLRPEVTLGLRPLDPASSRVPGF
jgi:hypothetical protein